MGRHVVLRVFSASLLFGPLVASAAPITVPTGLNPGDQYRLVFVTSTTRDATSANIADYNAFVTAAANSVFPLAALGTTRKAIGSTSSVDARDNTGTNPVDAGVPIYATDGNLFATGNSDMWDGSIQHLSIPDEQGVSTLTEVWTGSYWDGTGSPSGKLGEPSPGTGNSESQVLPETWMNWDSQPSTNQHPLYAMSDVLTVVSEPSSLVLTICAACGAWIGARQARVRSKPLPSR